MNNVVALRPSTNVDDILIQPKNIEAEVAIIGSALVNNSVIDQCPWLEADDFFEPVHGRIWEAMTQAVAMGRRADPISIRRLFDTDQSLADMDGGAYLARLAQAADSIINAVEYAREVKDTARLREVFHIGEQLRQRAADPQMGNSASAIVGEFRAHLDALCVDTTRPMAKHVSHVIDHLVKRIDSPPKIWSTGIPAVDKSIGGGVPEGYVIGIDARPKNFKAQPVTEPVLRRDGTWCAIGQLRMGDELASADGAPSRVVGVYPQGRRVAYRVGLSDGRSVLADAEHLWSVRTAHASDGTAVDRIVTTAELTSLVGKAKPVWLPQQSGHFGGAPMPVDPYVLGALLGNGSLTKPRSVRISISDPEMVQLIASRLPAGVEIRSHGGLEYYIGVDAETRAEQKGAAVNAVLEGLAELGVMGKPAQEKFIPAIYFTASRADRLALLQGLVDTDAQVMGGHASFISSSQQLAVDVQRLAWSLGMMAKAAKPAGTRYSYKGEWLDGRTAYRVSIRSDNPQELGLMVSKRADLIVRRKNFIRLRVTSVEQEAEHECVCIKVSHPSSLYVTSDYVLTHNTGVAHTLLLAMARQRIPSCYMALEMGSARLTQRMIGQLGKFNSAMFQYGGEQIRQRVTEARPMLDGLPLWFIDAPGMKFSRLKAEAAQQRMVNGVRVFVLDYWQLVCPDGKTGNKADFLGEVADWCARDAHEHGTTWIVLSQENRAGESLGSDGLARACDYLAQLHKHEQLFHGPGLDGVETLWWDVKFSRDGSGKNIGSPESPVLYISKHGPHLAEIGQHVP